jgi:hypothetical protein
MNDTNTDFVEARRRASALSDAQWLEWLAYVQAHNGSLTLPFDGSPPFAEYPAKDSPRVTSAPQRTDPP